MPTPAEIEIVKSWQQRLLDVATSEGKANPLPVFGADGLGGRETQAALISFQKSHPPLAVTGQFDEATRAALAPHRQATINVAEVAVISAALSHLPFVPQAVKDLLMFPTLVQLVISIIPGIPDDIAAVEKEITEIASTDSGIAKIKSFIAFARVILAQAEAVVEKMDPTGATVASTPIPPAVAALAPSK